MDMFYAILRERARKKKEEEEKRMERESEKVLLYLLYQSPNVILTLSWRLLRL